MSVRARLERWFVGDSSDGDGVPASSAPAPPTMLELARVGEVADALRTHLATQESERAEVLRVLTALSDPLAALPRMAAQQDRLGETIGQALVMARQRDANIDATMARIVEGIAQQTEVAGLIQQQLDLNLQAANGVAEGTTRLTEAVTELAASSRRGTELLSTLVEQSRLAADSGASAVRSAQRWLVVTVALGALGVVVALAAVALALSR